MRKVCRPHGPPLHLGQQLRRPPKPEVLRPIRFLLHYHERVEYAYVAVEDVWVYGVSYLHDVWGVLVVYVDVFLLCLCGVVWGVCCDHVFRLTQTHYKKLFHYRQEKKRSRHKLLKRFKITIKDFIPALKRSLRRGRKKPLSIRLFMANNHVQRTYRRTGIRLI